MVGDGCAQHGPLVPQHEELKVLGCQRLGDHQRRLRFCYGGCAQAAGMAGHGPFGCFAEVVP